MKKTIFIMLLLISLGSVADPASARVHVTFTENVIVNEYPQYYVEYPQHYVRYKVGKKHRHYQQHCHNCHHHSAQRIRYYRPDYYYYVPQQEVVIYQQEYYWNW